MHRRKLDSLLLMLVAIVVGYSPFLVTVECSKKQHARRNDKPGSKREVSKAFQWNYQDVYAWGDVYKVCAEGKQQSPIHIATHEAMMDPVLFNDPLKFVNYADSLTGTLTNNGHAVVWTSNETTHNLPRIIGSGYGHRGYIFDAMYFHWSSALSDSSYLGSEHVIDYRSGPMELQILHHNVKYESLEVAQKEPDGLAILAFLFTPVDSSVADGEYSKIASSLPQISKPKEKVSLSLHFSQLLSRTMLQHGVYFRYNGSLTVPPCTESVTWTVFHDRIPISTTSLAAFRAHVKTDINAGGGGGGGKLEPLDDNFRPIQRLNGRVVKTNSHDAQVPAGFNPPAGRRTSASSPPNYRCHPVPAVLLATIAVSSLLFFSFL